MSVQIIMDRDVYLDSPVTPVTLTNAIYAGDADAQRIRFRCFQRHGQIAPMDLSEITITAHFIRPDGGDVVITGTGGSNYSYVDLPEACYVYPGIFKLLVRASTTDPDVVTSILYVTGRIDKPTTDVIIDPGTTIPSLEDLLAQIDACEAAEEAANAAAADATAAAAAGVRTDTDAQGLTDTQKANARTNIGAADAADVSQLSEEITNITGAEPIQMTEGAYYNLSGTTVTIGSPTSNNTKKYALVACNSGDIFTVSASGGTSAQPYAFVDENGNILLKTGNTSTETVTNKILVAPENSAYLIINDFKSNDTVSYKGRILVDFVNMLGKTISGVQTGEMDGLRYVKDYSNGTYYNSPSTTPMLSDVKNRIRPSNFIYVKKNDVISITNGSHYVNALCVWTGDIGTASRVYIDNDFILTDQTYTVTADGFFIVSFGDATDRNAELDPAQFDGSITITSYAMREKAGIDKYVKSLSNGDDLNDLYENGWYHSSAAHNYLNTPEPDGTTGQRIVFIFSGSFPNSTTYRTMFYYNYATNCFAVRFFYSSSWHDWVKPSSLKYIKSLSNGDNLNDLYENGWYLTSYAHNYLNTPESDSATGWRVVCVLGGPIPNATTYKIMVYYNYKTRVFGVRYYFEGAWQKWRSNLDYKDTVSESFTPSAQTSQGANTGDKIRVMSYNVARWNNDSSTYIPDEKVFNLRKMFGKANADFVCLQEAYTYIDGPQSTGTKSAASYLFAPLYPYAYGIDIQANTILSKIEKIDDGRVKFSVYANQYRGIKWATYAIGNHTLLVASSHPNYNDAHEENGETATNIAARYTHYSELFGWLNGDITLRDYTTDEAVYAPTHTHVIVGMDANTSTPTDKTNLQTLAASNGFILGNGGALGWFLTGQGSRKWALDNICVSDNIIINNIEAWTSWFGELYSDHCPLVADLTLL